MSGPGGWVIAEFWSGFGVGCFVNPAIENE